MRHSSPEGVPTEVCLVDGGSFGESRNSVVLNSSSIAMSGATVDDGVIACDSSTIRIAGSGFEVHETPAFRLAECLASP